MADPRKKSLAPVLRRPHQGLHQTCRRRPSRPEMIVMLLVQFLQTTSSSRSMEHLVKSPNLVTSESFETITGSYRAPHSITGTSRELSSLVQQKNSVKWLENKYIGLEDRLDERKKVSKEVAIDFCQKLISNDFRAIHFYTLNQSELTLSVCQSLNIRDE